MGTRTLFSLHTIYSRAGSAACNWSCTRWHPQTPTKTNDRKPKSNTIKISKGVDSCTGSETDYPQFAMHYKQSASVSVLLSHIARQNAVGCTHSRLLCTFVTTGKVEKGETSPKTQSARSLETSTIIRTPSKIIRKPHQPALQPHDRGTLLSSHRSRSSSPPLHIIQRRLLFRPFSRLPRLQVALQTSRARHGNGTRSKQWSVLCMCNM